MNKRVIVVFVLLLSVVVGATYAISSNRSAALTIDVSVVGRDLAGLEPHASEMRIINDASVWMEHDVVLTNAGQETVWHALDGSGAYLGDKQLLVHDRMCGPSWSDGKLSDGIACSAVGSIPQAIAPGESSSFPISIAKGLEGMAQLEPGTFEFDRPVQYKIVTAGEEYFEAPMRTGHVTLRYEVQPSPTERKKHARSA